MEDGRTKIETTSDTITQVRDNCMEFIFIICKIELNYFFDVIII